MNGAISGAKTIDQLSVIRAIPPARIISHVILVSGANDPYNHDYPLDLEALWNELRGRGAELFLVAEPSEPPLRTEYLEKHSQAQDFSRSKGLSFFNPEAQLLRKNLEGYLWWDFVHFTDLGFQMMADCLFSALQRFLRVHPSGNNR